MDGLWDHCIVTCPVVSASVSFATDNVSLQAKVSVHGEDFLVGHESVFQLCILYSVKKQIQGAVISLADLDTPMGGAKDTTKVLYNGVRPFVSL